MGFFSSVGKFLSKAPIVGDVISAAGDFLGAQSAKKQQKRALASQEELNARNIQFQKQFAQQGIRWRVRDAQNAGLHPLIGAGIQPAQFQSQYIDGGRDTINEYAWLKNAGQNMGRSIRSTMTKEEREIKKIDIEIAKQDLQTKVLHNEALRNELNKHTEVGPPFPGARRDKGGYWHGDLPDDYDILIDKMKKKGVTLESQLTFDNMTGVVKYYPSQDIMDLISESMIAAASYYKGLGTYKSVMMHGKANPRTKNGKFYQAEKRRIESKIGLKVRLTDAGQWQVRNWRQR